MAYHLIRRFIKLARRDCFIVAHKKLIEVSISHDGRFEDFSIPYRKTLADSTILDIIAYLKKHQKKPIVCAKTVYYRPRAYDYLNDILILINNDPKSVHIETDYLPIGKKYSYNRRSAKITEKIADLDWRLADDGTYEYKTILFHVDNVCKEPPVKMRVISTR